MLRGVAKLLRREMRRWTGGPLWRREIRGRPSGHDLDDACKAARRACEAIAKSLFRWDGQGTSRDHQLRGGRGARSGEHDDVLGAGRQGPYAAKENGRNCVYWHDGETLDRLPAARTGRSSSSQAQTRRAQSPPARTRERTRKPRPRRPAPRSAKPDLPGAVGLDAVSGLPACDLLPTGAARTAEWKRGGPTFSVTLIEVDQ